MSFRFQFEVVLRVRDLLERQALADLERSLARLRFLQHSLDAAETWARTTARERAGATQLPAQELHFVEDALRQARAAMRECERFIVEEEARVQALRAAYLAARSRREIVSILRDNAAHAYQQEMTRREQAQVDEMFLTRFGPSRSQQAEERS